MAVLNSPAACAEPSPRCSPTRKPRSHGRREERDEDLLQVPHHRSSRYDVPLKNPFRLPPGENRRNLAISLRARQDYRREWN